MRGLASTLGKRLDSWLFRIRPAESGPIQLIQRRIFVLPSGAGLLLGLTLLAMLLGAINYSLGLGFALTFLLAGVALSSLLQAFRNLLGLSIRPGSCAPVFAGEPANFTLLVHNPRPTPRLALQCWIKGCPVTDFQVSAEATAHVALVRPTRKRGRLEIGRVLLETRFPLGLIRAWSVFTPDASCLVYPQPEANPPPLPTGPSNAQAHQQGAFGHDDFAGLRNHLATDSPRHIAWKVYAREGPLMVKEFAGGDAGEIVLDWETLPMDLATEARLSRLTAWVCQAAALGLPFSLKLPGLWIPPSAGTPHASRCLEALALFTPPASHGQA